MEYLSNPDVNISAAHNHNSRWLVRLFWQVTLLLFISVAVNHTADLMSKVAALIIISAALIPSYLWCSGRVKGLPLFPMFCFPYIFSHGLPLITEEPVIKLYTATQHFNAALAVGLFLGAGTVAWRLSARPKVAASGYLWTLNDKQPFTLFAGYLFVTAIFFLALNSGYLWVALPSQIVSILRTVVPAGANFVLMVLGYQLGEGKLMPGQRNIFIGLLALIVFVTGVTLYLNVPGIFILVAIAGYFLGSKILPWRILLILVLIMAFLNLAKGEMRGEYWRGATSPTQYPQLYAEWVSKSADRVTQLSDLFAVTDESSLANRISIVEMLLLVQSKTGESVPYLQGQTYAIIPELLVPRFFVNNKIRGAEATHMMSVHYGLKTYEDTFTTSIAWGLLQEAYANFGWLGVMSLGYLLGNLYGSVTQWAAGVPETSYRFLVSLVFVQLALKTELTLGSFITILTQLLILCFLLRIFFMGPRKYLVYNA